MSKIGLRTISVNRLSHCASVWFTKVQSSKLKKNGSKVIQKPGKQLIKNDFQLIEILQPLLTGHAGLPSKMLQNLFQNFLVCVV